MSGKIFLPTYFKPKLRLKRILEKNEELLQAFALEAQKRQNSIRIIQMAFRAGVTKLTDVEVVRNSRFSKQGHVRGLIFNLLGI